MNTYQQPGHLGCEQWQQTPWQFGIAFDYTLCSKGYIVSAHQSLWRLGQAQHGGKLNSVPVDRSTWDFTSFARDLSDESKLEMDSS